VGDGFCETTVLLQLTAAAPSAAQPAAAKLTEAKLSAALLKGPASAASGAGGAADGSGQASAVVGVLQSDEERAREAQVLPQSTCLEWKARRASVLAPSAAELQAMAAAEERRHAGAGTGLVGVVLPMAPARAQERLPALLAAVAEIVGLPGDDGVRVVGAWGRTTAYCAVASVAGLRKQLSELSNAQLRPLARDTWGVAVADDAPRADVVAGAAVAFVRRELQGDLAAALRCGFASADGADGAGRLETALDALLLRWTASPGPADAPPMPAPGAGREERIAAAVGRLDSEKRWGEVEGWVGLYRVRMQGRTREGLEQLMAREAVRIARCGLGREEVLALRLYTGASAPTASRPPGLRFCRDAAVRRPWCVSRVPACIESSSKLIVCVCVCVCGVGRGRAGVRGDERHLPQLPAGRGAAARGRRDDGGQQAVHDALLHLLGHQEDLPDHGGAEKRVRPAAEGGWMEGGLERGGQPFAAKFPCEDQNERRCDDRQCRIRRG